MDWGFGSARLAITALLICPDLPCQSVNRRRVADWVLIQVSFRTAVQRRGGNGPHGSPLCLVDCAHEISPTRLWRSWILSKMSLRSVMWCSILRTAWMTVVWSRLPKARPISG